MGYRMPSMAKIQKMNRNAAIHESMKKWMKIAEGEAVSCYADNCVLCAKYNGLGFNCEKCPLYLNGLSCEKIHSPWNKYCRSYTSEKEQVAALNMWLALASCLG